MVVYSPDNALIGVSLIVGKEFDRIIVFSDSQDCDFPNLRIPEPYGTYNYICDVSANTKGVNYRGKWTAEISGFFRTFPNLYCCLRRH